MSWSAEGRAVAVLGAILGVLGLAGCYAHHLCGAPEVCNYQDDDCDHVVDEGFVDDAGVYFTKQNCGGWRRRLRRGVPHGGRDGV